MYNFINNVNNNIGLSFKRGGPMNWGESHFV